MGIEERPPIEPRRLLVAPGELLEREPAAVVLGSDPFSDPVDSEALDAWLDALERLAVRPPGGQAASGELAAASAGNAVAADDDERAVRAPEPAPAPRVAEVEIGPELRTLARLVGEDPARRLAALLARLDGYDHFGLSAGGLRQAFPLFYAIYRSWFRVQSCGHAHVPGRGPAVLVANHGGLLPFDGAMTVVDLLLHSDPPRLARALVDRWAGSLPWINVFFARVGQVVGTHENFERLLADGEPVLVFPEGMEGIRKPITQRYRLQRFHVGFVEHALRARAPIVPVAILGSDDQAPILFDVKPLARWLGLPTAPITPTFPWLGPLGLLPYPVRYRIVYGEPIRFHERFAAHAADDPAVVRALAGQVRRAVQGLIDKNR
jgi:1-acyl-sn-glycerol-3-phosphate acyltransferase